jgi:hypothetical protein
VANGRIKKYVQPDDAVRLIGCYSEVNMHMGVAGKPIIASIKEQVFDGRSYYSTRYIRDGREWSTVTLGEGGFYQEDTADGPRFYCYPDDGPGDEDPKAVQRDITQLISSAISGAGVSVTTITNLGLN